MSNTDQLRLRDYTIGEEINLSVIFAKGSPDRRRERVDFISNQKRKNSPGFIILRDVSTKRMNTKYNQI